MGCRFRLVIVSCRITKSVKCMHTVHMSFYLPSAIYRLFRSLPSDEAAASHAVPMTELQLFYSEKACTQNGWPAVSRRQYCKSDSPRTTYYTAAGFSWAGQLFLTPAAQRWQVANEYVLYVVQLHCWEGSLTATESCDPALVLPWTPVSLGWPSQWPLYALLSMHPAGSLSQRQVCLPPPHLSSHFSC